MARVDGLIEATLLLLEVPMRAGAPALHHGEHRLAALARSVSGARARKRPHERLHLQAVPVGRQVKVDFRIRRDLCLVALDATDVGMDRD